MIKETLTSFISYIQTDQDVELYNEAGLQHELAWYLRDAIGKEYVIKLEYPTHKANVVGKLVKKEMDIYLVHRDSGERYCIELKAPVNLQVPNIMFLAIEDIVFLSQLKNDKEFTHCYLLFATHNDDFWKTKRDVQEIYKMFRGRINIQTLMKAHVPEFIQKKYPNDPIYSFDKNHEAEWIDLRRQGHESWRCFLIEV